MLRLRVLQRKSRNNLGRSSEDFAASYVSRLGYKILDRNFKSKFGEIDIIAEDYDTLVFVEVKARLSLRFGAPEEAVTPWKINKIRKTGEYYSLLHPKLPKKLRIDVVAILIEHGKHPQIKLIKIY